MKFLTKKVFSLGAIIGFHVSFSVALVMAWTAIKRGWDFSVTSFSSEIFYASGGAPGRFDIAAVVIGALFKYLHFNHMTFYLFNILLSTATVIVFYHLARTCLERKFSLYVTAIFALNPEFAFYNNFVLKENALILFIIIAMYLFFRALDTNLFGYKVFFFLLLPLIVIVREPLVLTGLLLLAFLRKSTRRFILLSGAAAVFVLLFIMHEQSVLFFKAYWVSHLGHYGATKIILEKMYGTPTVVTFGEIFSSPSLFVNYYIRSFLYYIRPGWSAGMKLNSFLIPYTLFTVYVFIASFRYRKYLTSNYRTAYLLIASTIILISLILIIYDPIERYRYSVYQLGFTLLVLNLKGYQEYIFYQPNMAATRSEADMKYAMA